MGNDLDLDGYDSVEDYCDDNGGDPRDYDSQGRYLHEEDEEDCYEDNGVQSVHVKIPGYKCQISIVDGEVVDIKTEGNIKVTIS